MFLPARNCLFSSVEIVNRSLYHRIFMESMFLSEAHLEDFFRFFRKEKTIIITERWNWSFCSCSYRRQPSYRCYISHKISLVMLKNIADIFLGHLHFDNWKVNMIIDCAQWVPKLLVYEHQNIYAKVCSELKKTLQED